MAVNSGHSSFSNDLKFCTTTYACCIICIICTAGRYIKCTYALIITCRVGGGGVAHGLVVGVGRVEDEGWE